MASWKAENGGSGLTSERQERLPYLDGLRGCSILSVLILHATLAAQVPGALRPCAAVLGNGRLGVNLFFVLSGFLIHGLLLRELDRSSTISLAGFYQRRVARIFPAAYAFVAWVAVLAALHMVHLGWRPLAAAATFTWNYVELARFFPLNHQTNLLNHYWTLSLEEQFYIVWPGCLLLLGRIRAQRVALAGVLLVPFVRVLSYVFLKHANDQLEGMFHTTVDEILFGVLAAYVYSWDGFTKFVSRAPFRICVGLLTVFVLLVLPLAAERFGWVGRFIVPTANSLFSASAILWLLGGSGGWIRHGLESAALRLVGVLSFSLYLWQQAFFAPSSPVFTTFPFNFALAFLAAALSYYVIERPARQRLRAAFGQRESRFTAKPTKGDAPGS